MTHDHATLVRLPLATQSEKLGRILDQRVAHYRRAVRLGRRPLEWGALKHAECEDIRRSFAWLLANRTWAANAQKLIDLYSRLSPAAPARMD